MPVRGAMHETIIWKSILLRCKNVVSVGKDLWDVPVVTIKEQPDQARVKSSCCFPARESVSFDP